MNADKQWAPPAATRARALGRWLDWLGIRWNDNPLLWAALAARTRPSDWWAGL